MREKPERAFEIFFNVQRFAGRIYVRLSDLSRYVRGTYIRMSDGLIQVSLSDLSGYVERTYIG
jgi:hypothetical protein